MSIAMRAIYLELVEPTQNQNKGLRLSLIHISEPTRPLYISYAVFCLKKINVSKKLFGLSVQPFKNILGRILDVILRFYRKHLF